jgi:transposase InsO family protein
MDLEDAETRVKFALHDRDASFTTTFDAVFQAAGIRVIRSAVQAPRMNSIMERWIGSCRRELLDRTLIWNQRHLMTVLREYEDFYNTHRPYRTLNPVGFLNSATCVELGFYAARSYSSMRPRTARRLIRSRDGSAVGWSGRGGCSWRLR